MPEDPNAVNPSGTVNSNLSPGATPPVNPSGTESQTSPSMTLDQALDALRRTRTEAAEHRTKLKAFEDEAEARKKAQMSDLEKAQAELTRLQGEREQFTRTYQERLVGYEVQLAAARLGIIDPVDAVKLLDWSELEFDESGAPKNAVKLLEKLVKEKPYLVQPAGQSRPTGGGATNPSRSGTSGSGETPLSQDYIDQIIKTNPQEYVRRGDEIRHWLLTHPRQPKR